MTSLIDSDLSPPEWVRSNDAKAVALGIMAEMNLEVLVRQMSAFDWLKSYRFTADVDLDGWRFVREGMGIMHLLAILDRPEEIKAMWLEDADLGVLDENRRTPLWWCAWFGSERAAAMLIECGALIDLEDDDKGTPLSVAAISGQTKIVELLLRLGSNPNLKDRWGRTPLHEARTPHVAMALMAMGADLHVVDNKGFTPLAYGVFHERIAMVRHFCRVGAGQKEWKDPRGGLTLLHICESPKIARLLLSHIPLLQQQEARWLDDATRTAVTGTAEDFHISGNVNEMVAFWEDWNTGKFDGEE